MNIHLTNNKKSLTLSSGTILLFMVASASLVHATFHRAAQTFRHGTRCLAPALQRQLSTHNLPTKTFSHRAQDQRHWLQTMLVPATVAALFMANHRETAHCSPTPAYWDDEDGEWKSNHNKQTHFAGNQRTRLQQLLLDAVKEEDYVTAHKLLVADNPTAALRDAVENNQCMLVYHLLGKDVSVENFGSLFLQKIAEDTSESNESNVVASLLLSANPALAQAKDCHGNTALHIAARRQYETLTQALIAAGADVNAQNHNGSTPLHEAVFPGNEDCVRLLLDNGANVDAVDDDVTPLMIAATQKGNIENIKLLVEHGADVHKKGKRCVCAPNVEIPFRLDCQYIYVSASSFALEANDTDMLTFLQNH